MEQNWLMQDRRYISCCTATKYVKQHGLQVDSCDGSFHLDDVNAYLYTKDMPSCDVVLVCLKSVNNGKLQSLLPPLLHSKTLVVLIQNGIGVEEDVQKMFPDVQLAAGRPLSVLPRRSQEKSITSVMAASIWPTIPVRTKR